MPNSTQAHEARAAGMEENKEELEQKISQMTLYSDASMTSSQMLLLRCSTLSTQETLPVMVK